MIALLLLKTLILPGNICQETAGNDFSAEMASVSPKASPLKQGRQKRIIPIIEKWEREETCK